MVSIGRNNQILNDLVAQIRQSDIQSLSRNPVSVLRSIQGVAANAAFTDVDPASLNQMIGARGLPSFGDMPSPSALLSMMRPLCGAGYAGTSGQPLDDADQSPRLQLRRILDRKRRGAHKMHHVFARNPYARSAFEATVGGLVVPDGRNDGRVTIQRFPTGFQPPPGATNPMANTCLGCLAGMDAAITQAAGQLAILGTSGGSSSAALAAGNGGAGFGGTNGSSYGNYALAGMTSVASGMAGGNGLGALGGIGAASWNPNDAPGRINNTNPAYEQASQAQINSTLADPSLTVEDKVTLVIMLIMEKADKDIERQAQYVNAVQQQQANTGANSAQNTKVGKVGNVQGAAFGGPAGQAVGGLSAGNLGGAIGGNVGGTITTDSGNAPSIDVETMKLKRMIDKRGQMFDMLTNIINQYNQTAKNIIQSMR